jgi:hypothetical protein
MNRETLKRLAANPNFISGIYNYCDRWCEHCPFTARCMNFALEPEHLPADARQDIRNADFWAEIAGMLQASVELLHEMAAEREFDLDAVDATQLMTEEERRRQSAEDELCSRASKAYADRTEHWLAAAGDLFRLKDEALTTARRLGLYDTDPAEEANRLSDAVAIIRWYQFQIHVKLMRAFHGRRAEAKRAGQLAEFPQDSDGSAKVAIIGIDRSMAAWCVMLRAFPAQETGTLEILAHLDRLRRDVEREFPAARSFMRPGFDTGGV